MPIYLPENIAFFEKPCLILTTAGAQNAFAAPKAALPGCDAVINWGWLFGRRNGMIENILF
ncbi:MAG: hypothetical protein GXY32_04070 [Ruminococcaceae bacterium]|nr:hypothetical protein [Oscillospiraceae bacterium]